MSSWSTEYYDLIEDCENRESKLTEWEADFIQSIKERLDSGKFLTPKQIEILDNIWGRVTRNG